MNSKQSLNKFYLDVILASKMFGCSPQTLTNILITRTVESGSDKVTASLSKGKVCMRQSQFQF